MNGRRIDGALWEQFAVGDLVELRAASSLHRDPYPVRVIGRRPDRLELSFPMKEGRIVLLPVGSSVAMRRCEDSPAEVWTKLVQRVPGSERSVFVARPGPHTPLVSSKPRQVAAPIIAMAGGKGGTGTTVLAVNLAASLAALGKTVCLVEGVPGAGNADVLLNVHPQWRLPDVMQGERSAFEAAVRGPGSVLLLAGGHPGTPRRLGLRAVSSMMAKLQQLSYHVDVILLDAGNGAGVHQSSLFARADERILVTTSDPHAVTDAYALLQMVSRWEGRFPCWIIVNQVSDIYEGEALARKMEFAAERFLGVDARLIGVIPRDRAVARSVRRQRFFVHETPGSLASVAVRMIARELMGEGSGVTERPERPRRRWRPFWRSTQDRVRL